MIDINTKVHMAICPNNRGDAQTLLRPDFGARGVNENHPHGCKEGLQWLDSR